MRNATRNIATVVGLGVLGVSYSIGATAEVSSGFNAIGAPTAPNDTSGLPATGADAGSTTPAGDPSGGDSSGNSSGASGSSGGSGSKGSSSGTSGGSSSSTNGGSASGGSSSSGSSSGASGSSGSVSTPAPTQAPAGGGSNAGSGSNTTPTKDTKSGSAIQYAYGVIQVSVTKTGSKITDITYLQSSATHGREQAFPYLVQYAIQAQGTGFGNMSGATYTTDAFKQALSSALGKF